MLFAKNIEKIIGKIAELLSKSSVLILGEEFREGFYCYFEEGKPPAECYGIIFPADAIIRMDRKIDDEKERELVQSIFPQMKDLINVMRRELLPPSDNRYTWSLACSHVHFADKNVEILYNYAVDCILKYQKYYFIANIPA